MSIRPSAVARFTMNAFTSEVPFARPIAWIAFERSPAVTIG